MILVGPFQHRIFQVLWFQSPNFQQLAQNPGLLAFSWKDPLSLPWKPKFRSEGISHLA